MDRVRLFALAAGGAAAVLLLSAAQRPAALAPTSGGLWEINGVPTASGPVRMCLGDTVELAQFEHRGQNCRRTLISDTPSTTVIHYTCAGGGFGETRMTLVTPRSLRVETQGISGNFPFHYVLQARRIGDCRGAATASAH